MGMFDDLIPEQPQQQSGGMFDDLIPEKERTSFDELRDNLSSKMPPPYQMLVSGLNSAFGKEYVEGLQRQAADGMLMGFSDEAEGLARSVVNDTDYTAERDQVRVENKQFKKENPKASLAANLAGGLTTGGAGLTKTVAAKAGAGLGGKILTGAATGAAFGTVAGAGNSEAELTGEDKETNKFLMDTGKGTLTGAVVGGGLTAAFSLGSTAIQKVVNKFQENKQLKEILNDPNLPARINGEDDAQAVFNAIDGAADKVLINGAKKTHEQAAKAIQQGFKKGDVFVARSASAETRKGALDMINSYQRGLNNPRYAQDNQVTDIVGKAALKRFSNISRINDQAGKQVDAAAKGLAGKPIDASDQVSGFMSKLEGTGVTMTPKGRGVELSFKGSDFEGIPEAQKIIQNVTRRLSQGELNAQQAHKLKRYIDNNVSYGGNKSGAEAQAENIIKELRKGLNENLKGISSAYDKANVKYSDTVSVINEVKGLVGKNGITARTLGLLNNRVDSRAVSSDRVSQIYSSLDDVSAKYGVRFKDSVSDLHIMANAIDSTLPTSLNNSLQGQVGNAGSKLAGAAEDLGNRTVWGTTLQLGKSALDRAKGIDTQSQIKAFRDLIKSDVAFSR